MNLKRILDIYEVIKKRLPKTYPRPKLAFYQDEECMLDNHKVRKYSHESVFAVVDPSTNTINLPMKITLSTDLDDKVVEKTILINRQAEIEIAEILLHELAHMYAGYRYGWSSDQYFDEKYCDRFAIRWLKVLCNEDLLRS